MDCVEGGRFIRNIKGAVDLSLTIKMSSKCSAMGSLPNCHSGYTMAFSGCMLKADWS